MASTLPLPSLTVATLDAIDIVTDNALARQTGVRVAFTGRSGGVSEGPYESLNLGAHVNDDPMAVARNREILVQALGGKLEKTIIPNQVHGTNLVVVEDASQAAVEEAKACAISPAGADGVVVGVSEVAALLCFADCVSVVIVSPSGRFAVVHAGWRGVEASIAVRAIHALEKADAQFFGPSRVKEGLEEGPARFASRYNVYLGPHIRGKCFETGPDVYGLFVKKFGEECALDNSHISLSRALRVDLERAGVSPSRIADAGICTMCESDRFFSYRASGGTCGRHAAIAIRKEMM